MVKWELTRSKKAMLSSSFLVTRNFCREDGGAKLICGLYDQYATQC